MRHIRFGAPVYLLFVLVACNEGGGGLQRPQKKSTDQTERDASVEKTADSGSSSEESKDKPTTKPTDTKTPGGTTGDNNSNDVPKPAPKTPVEDYCYKADADICATHRAIVNGTNEIRAKAGVAPLKYSVMMTFAAKTWSQSQAQAGSISHNGFPSQRQSIVTTEFNQKQAQNVFSINGENVAMFGMQGSLTPAEIGAKLVTMWKNSSGHYKNMVDSSFKAMGAGVYIDKGDVYGTQIFGLDSKGLDPAAAFIDLNSFLNPFQ